jgi:hypothetical protein
MKNQLFIVFVIIASFIPFFSFTTARAQDARNNISLLAYGKTALEYILDRHNISNQRYILLGTEKQTDDIVTNEQLDVINVTNSKDGERAYKIAVDSSSQMIMLWDFITWYIDFNRNGAFDFGTDVQYSFDGQPGDSPLAIDWDGNGQQEMAIFRPGGTWDIDLNHNGSIDPGIDWTNSPYTFGRQPSDIPLTIDWDGDGDQELAIFRQGGTWFIDVNHTGNFDSGVDWTNSPNTFGREASDIPLAIDWNGDGIQELAIFRQGGTWYIDMNHTGNFDSGVDWTNYPYTFGSQQGDKPVAIDWDGNGTQELAIYCASSQTWFIDTNRNGVFNLGVDVLLSPFGIENGEQPLAIDWDGDARQELCVCTYPPYEDLCVVISSDFAEPFFQDAQNFANILYQLRGWNPYCVDHSPYRTWWQEETSGGIDDQKADYGELSFLGAHGFDGNNHELNITQVAFPLGGYIDDPTTVKMGYLSSDSYGYNIWNYIPSCRLLKDTSYPSWATILQGTHMLLGYKNDADGTNEDMEEMAYRLTGAAGWEKQNIQYAYFSTYVKDDDAHRNNQARILAENNDVLDNDWIDSYSVYIIKDGYYTVVTCQL